MKVALLIARLADSIIFIWILLNGFIHLWNDDIPNACMLIGTAVLWQRFERLTLLNALRSGDVL